MLDAVELMLLWLFLLLWFFLLDWWGRRLRAVAMSAIYLWYLGLVLLLSFTNLGEGVVSAVSLPFLLLLPEPALFILLLC